MRPKPQDARAWQLRLQELLQTREELIWSGYLYKEKPDLSDVVTASRVSGGGAGGGADGAGDGRRRRRRRRRRRAADVPSREHLAPACRQRCRLPSRPRCERGGGHGGWGRRRRPFARNEVAARAADEPRWVRYYFVLYGNGVLMYFSDAESAHLGQAWLPSREQRAATHKARRRLAAGHHVRFISGKNANLHAVVVEARHKGAAKAKYRVTIESTGNGKAKSVDVAATSLSYWYEGADGEPTCEVDERGIASQSILELVGGPLGRDETWRLGADCAPPPTNGLRR